MKKIYDNFKELRVMFEMRKKLGRLVMNGGLSEEEYKSISLEIHNSNRQNLTVFTIVSAFFLMIMTVLSCFISDIEKNRIIYLGSMVIMAAIMIISQVFGEKSRKLILICVYGFISLLFIFGIVIGTWKNPDNISTAFIALLLTVPMLFTDRPIRMIGAIIFYTAVFSFASAATKTADLAEIDIMDGCIFGAISAIVSSYMMSVKCERFIYERKAVVLSEIDVLTGLHNRNSYENSMETFPESAERTVSCVYIDVNGLHELNNSKGHEMGDRMLQFIANELKKQFGESTFRIGGDEFVAFAADMSRDETERRTGLITEASEKEGYHISVGIEVRLKEGLSMEELIRSAESEMYKVKRLYYEQNGNDRRSRR
ncbi:MAG: diguanylate cyclase [Oscillospiraceae bacterium]|nr:diguanylate cyclase [Oscillospiraceae bacterium]